MPVCALTSGSVVSAKIHSQRVGLGYCVRILVVIYAIRRSSITEETRIRWVQASSRAETIFAKLKEIVNSSVGAVEDRLARILEVRSYALASSFETDFPLAPEWPCVLCIREGW